MIFEDPQLRQEIELHAQTMHCEEGKVLMQPGIQIRFVPLVTKGCIRVLRQNDDGAETFLYHIMPGETCALSLSCCTAHRASGVKTVCEQDTELLAIPIRFVEEWYRFTEWREFVASTYQKRFDRLLEVIDDIAFRNLDERLWSYLVARSEAQGSKILRITHEDIAQEMGIQREAVTRLMRKLKEIGRIETSRNEIHILDSRPM